MMNESQRKAASNQNSLEITDLFSQSAQFPALAQGKDGALYISWQKYANGHDSLMVSCRRDGTLLWEDEISGGGEVLHPVLLLQGDVLWCAWSEWAGGRWRILARARRGDCWHAPIQAAEGEALFYPHLFPYRGEPHLLWTQQHSGSATAMLCTLGTEGAGRPEAVSLSKEAYRAAAAQGGDGNLYLAYDAYDGTQYHLRARVKTAAGWSGEYTVSQSQDWAAAPAVAPTPHGALVCWYDFGYQSRYSVQSADLTVQDGELAATAPICLRSGADWYMNLDASANSGGLQAIAYTRGKYDILVRCRRGSGPWGEPVLMSYGDGHCAVHPKVLVDEDDTIHLVWQFAHKNGHLDRNAQVVYNRLSFCQMDALADINEPENTFTQPIPGDKALHAHDASVVRSWLDRNGYHGLELKFGDIHGQSGLSDGMGEIDQYFHRARAKANLDFTALTDHDCYPDWLSQSEWELIRTTSRLMNKDDELVCLLAYEWTPNEYRYDFGHKNVYYRADEGELFRSCDKGGMTPTDLYQSLRGFDALCIPHHPAADWGHVSAATDWNFHAPDVQRAVEIFSRHAPFETLEATSVFTKNIKKMPRCSVQDALARGYRLGFTAGSDSHQTEHGVEGGIVAAFLPRLTRAHVWDALYHRLTYGTTGARILVSLNVNGAPMGSELSAVSGAAVKLEVSVLGTDAVTVELLRNNQTIHRATGPDGACDFTCEDICADNAHYYVRVTQCDAHMAWSSPVWVDCVSSKLMAQGPTGTDAPSRV